MKASKLAPVLGAVIAGWVSASVPVFAADEAAVQVPDLVGRSVQKAGASTIGLVVVSVPVDASPGGEAVAVAQARRLRSTLSRQGVEAANIYVEARSPSETER